MLREAQEGIVSTNADQLESLFPACHEYMQPSSKLGFFGKADVSARPCLFHAWGNGLNLRTMRGTRETKVVSGFEPQTTDTNGKVERQAASAMQTRACFDMEDSKVMKTQHFSKADCSTAACSETFETT